MCKYIYSFDIGVSSIGWSIRDLDKYKIVDLGVRLFEIPEAPKTKQTNASIRRTQRGARRLLKRRKSRIRNVKKLILDYSILTKEELDSLYEFSGYIEDIYKLRFDALDIPLSNLQICRILLFLAKNRGYKSNSKEDVLAKLNTSSSDKAKESKKVLNSISENNILLNEKKYRTIGELLYKDEKFKDKKKNTTERYTACFSRESIIDEAKTILKNQRDLGNTVFSEEFEDKYIELLDKQLPFLLKKDMESMIGKCTLIEGEKRAPKNSYTFERFILLSKLNNLKIDDVPLTKEQRTILLDLAYNQRKITYATLKKSLNLDNKSKFNLIDYHKYESTEEAEKNTFIELNGYHSLKKVFQSKDKSLWLEISSNIDLLDKIAYIISVCKGLDEFRENMSGIVPEEYIDGLFALDFSNFGNISIKAIKKIMPFMEDRIDYTTSCINAGLNPDGYSLTKEKSVKIDASILDEIDNTRIKRIFAEFRKVYNNMVVIYGAPKEVNIEVARDIAQSKRKKNVIKKEQVKNAQYNAALTEEFNSLFGRDPKYKEKIKFRLWKEQNELCMYSGYKIPKEYIIDDSKLEIDHAFHISLSGDDSLNNKVLVLKKENQNKGARTPFEYFENNIELWDKYIERVNNSTFSTVKKNKLKQQVFNTDNGFINRYLNDTREITISLYRYIKNNLIGYNNEKIKVRCVNGALTSFLRGIWNIPKYRSGVYHHIEDSLIIGCCDEKFIQRVSKISKDGKLYNEKNNPSDNVFELFPLPYEHFIEEMKARLSNNPIENINIMIDKYSLNDIYSDEFISKLDIVYPSIKISNKIQGAIHPETIKSKKDTPVKRNSFEVRGGVTVSGFFVRIDIFKVNGSYKIVPIYRHDINKELSNITIGKNGITVSDDDFAFTLYKNDAVIIETNQLKPTLAFYVNTDVSDGRLNLKVFENGTFTITRFSLSKIKTLEKAQVDVLGKIHKVNKNSREKFNIKKLN